MRFNFINKIKYFFQNRKQEDCFCLRKERSGLPVNLFIDDIGGWYSKIEHCYLCKFQNNKSNLPDYTNSIFITINDNPKIIKKRQRIKLNDIEISQIKEFIIKQKSNLIKVATQEIDIFDFYEIM